MTTNKRSNARYDVTIPIRFRDAEDFLVEYTENISSGGVFIRTESPPETGTQLSLSLELPGTKTALPLEGEVAYIVPTRDGNIGGCGVRFLAPDPGTLQILQKFVDGMEKSTRGNVLIVDDDEAVLELLATTLRKNRFNVETYTNPVNALKAVNFTEFDVILSDLQMNRMDGMEFRDTLMQDEETAGIPFILLSGARTEADVEMATRLGVLTFLEKPVQTRELVDVIAEAFRTRKAKLEKKVTVPERAQRLNDIARRKMEFLGMECTQEQAFIEATVTFSHIELVNIATGERIAKARVRNVGHDRVCFVDPAHLGNLPAVPILDLADGDEFQRAVGASYRDRVGWVAMGRTVFDRFGVQHELSESGFCVIGRLNIGTDKVAVNIRNPTTAVIEAVNGRPLANVVNPSECIIDLAECESANDFGMVVETVVATHRAALQASAKPSAPSGQAGSQGPWLAEADEAAPSEAAPSEVDPPAAAEDLFGSMDDLWGEEPDEPELLLLDDDDFEPID